MQFLNRLQFEASYGAILAATDGATVTFDCAKSNTHAVTLGGARTLAVTGDVDNQRFVVILVQDGTGNRTVTWWSGIDWEGAVPVLGTAPGSRDSFEFIRLSAGVYLGWAHAGGALPLDGLAGGTYP